VQGCLFLPLCPTPESRLGVGKKLGGDTARTADPNWLMGYSVPDNVMICSNKQDRVRRRGLASKVTVVWRLARHWSALEGGDSVILLCCPALSPIKSYLS